MRRHVRDTSDRFTSRHQGSALVVVLWCLVILSIVVISMAHTTRTESQIVRNSGDSIQAYYHAIAGIETAKAIIHRETRGANAGNSDHRFTLYDNPAEFKDVEFGRGRFRVYRQGRQGRSAGAILYGVADEERHLDVNTVSAGELRRLEGLTDVFAASVQDWRDEDQKVEQNGAETEYYRGLREPYRPRNGPIETFRELLLVRGADARALFGEDRNANGLLDPNEDDGARQAPPDNANGRLDGGLVSFLTLDAAVPNENRRGEDRIDLTLAFAEEIAAIDGLNREIADLIVAYRDRKKLESLADLLDVARPQANSGGSPSGQPASAGSGPAPTGLSTGASVDLSSASRPAAPGGGASGRGPNDPNAPTGEAVISVELLQRIADDVTVKKERTLRGLVNVNTAPWQVIACLEGLGEDLARAIVDYRDSVGRFTNVAELLDVPGISKDVFKKIAERLSTRGGTFRIISEGMVSSTGARRRVEVVVRMDSFDVETLYYREDP